MWAMGPASSSQSPSGRASGSVAQDHTDYPTQGRTDYPTLISHYLLTNRSPWVKTSSGMCAKQGFVLGGRGALRVLRGQEAAVEAAEPT